MSKVTNIPSEIREFFKENRRESAIYTMTKVLESLNLNSKCLGGLKRDNCQFTNLQLFQLLVLMPVFAVTGISHYAVSGLGRMFGGKKDTLYTFMRQDDVNWRNIIYRVVVILVSRIVGRKDYKKSHLPRVLIVDDSDLHKTGFKMELIGKIYSHVQQKCILGYKALVMCWSDGRTQYAVDMSLHGEMGKVEGKEQGLTAKQRAKRFSKGRDENTHIATRKTEYFMGKGQELIEMVKRAIKSKIPFDYLLVDSWFTNTSLVDFVCHCHKKFHLLGMAKMGKTKYSVKKWGDMTAKAIISKLESKKEIKYARRYRCHYASVEAVLGKRAVKLFFCRRSKSEGWKVLLTTDASLDFMRAYEIYAMRWAIEVFFSDTKRLMGLEDCSARDFSSQIAHVSLVMIRYNVFALVKRQLDYETIGALFSDVYMGVHELTVVEKIWSIIVEVVSVVADLTGADEDTLMIQIIDDDKKLAALKAYAEAA